MNTRSSRTKRNYRSPLRESQAAATRRRILDTVMAEMSKGRTDRSVPHLARLAGCSVPTIYRHFPSRDDLLTALYDHINEQVPPPAVDLSPGRPAEIVRAFFEHEAARHQAVGTDLDTEEIWEFRRKVTVPKRRKHAAEMVEHWAPELGEPHRTWLEDLLVVLVSSTTAKAFRRYLDRGHAEAADRIAWAVEALLAQAAREAAVRHESGPSGTDFVPGD